MSIALPLAIVLFGLWSLISIAYPFKPFRSRKEALFGLLASFVGLIAAVIVAGSDGAQPKLAKNESVAVPIPNAETSAASAPDRPHPVSGSGEEEGAAAPQEFPENLVRCGTDANITDENLYISTARDLFLAPQANAEPVPNKKASEVLGQPINLRVIEAQQVSVLCQRDGWTLVRASEESSDAPSVGWVPDEALTTAASYTAPARSISIEDVTWTAETKKYRDKIIRILNSIAADNPNCRSLDPETLELSERGSKNDPVFFVTCEGGVTPFNIWFRPSDAGGSFAPPVHIERAAALQICEQAARTSAKHPSTVSFSRFMDVSWVTWPSGRAKLASTFTAKNSFNLELEYRIGCLFEGTHLIDIEINEAL